MSQDSRPRSSVLAGQPHERPKILSDLVEDAKDAKETSVPLIRDAVVQAAIRAGGGDLTAYLARQAEKHPSAFLTLLGKVLAMQVTGIDGNVVKTRIVFEIVDPVNKDD